MNWGKRLLCWMAIAFLVLFPSSLSLNSQLIGSPEIDVWNHAWGYWFVYQSLLQGTLPLETSLIGAPSGGILYYIDTPGAVAGLFATSLFGPAVGYNLVLLFRLALSGLAAQLLTEEWSTKGAHTWIAGLAVLTLPFLLCELANGISEVCSIQWAIFTLWAASRCHKAPTIGNWLLLGLFQGLTITSTFYYGLAIGLLLVVLFTIVIVQSAVQNKTFPKELIIGSLGAAILAIVVASPYAYAFWYTLQSDARLVLRDTSLNDQLLRHNAVDPRIYLQFGAFQSVNLAEQYGEPFIHTAYLRWSIILLSIYACITDKALRIWSIIAIFSLSLGLGPYLWWGEDWVSIGEHLISLPFDWLRALLPQIAITHPLRLSLGGQIIITCLGLVGLHHAMSKLPAQYKQAGWILAALIICVEGMWGSSATWPIPASDASIPSLYDQEDDRGVLDLPAEAGTSMKTSQYFWFQTQHQRPIPYTPDARLGSTRDLETFKNFMAADGIKEQAQTIPSQSQLHMRNLYGLIVLHTQLEPNKVADYQRVLTDAFGHPQEEDGHLFWLLEPLQEEEKAPETVRSSSPYSNLGEQTAPLVDCQNPEKAVVAFLEDQLSLEDQKTLQECGSALPNYCHKRCKSKEIDVKQTIYCLQIFSQYPSEEDVYAIMHLFRNKDPDILLTAGNTLLSLQPKYQPNLPAERFQKLANKQPPELQTIMLQLIQDKK